MQFIRQFLGRLPTKTLLILTLFIFTAIPLTVVAVFSIRNFSSSAAVSKLTNFSPVNETTISLPEFSWDCDCQENTYRLELRENDPNFASGSWIKDVKGTTSRVSTEFGDFAAFNYPEGPDSLKTGTKYYWRVSCLDKICEKYEPVSFTLRNKDFQKPSIPDGLQVINQNDASFTLTWDLSSDNVEVVGYSVIESTSSSAQTTHQVTENNYIKSSYIGSETYTFSVAAKDSAGNLSEYSKKLVFKAADKDSDHDGFLDSKELYFGTNPNNACKGHLSWPPDMTDDGKVDSEDLVLINRQIGTSKLPSQNRYDLNQNGLIDQADVAVVQSFLGKNC